MKNLEESINSARLAIRSHIAGLQSEIDGHAAWRERIENADELVTTRQEEITQARLIEVMDERISTMSQKRIKLLDDLTTLETDAPYAMANPEASHSALSRILKEWAAVEPLPQKKRATGLDSLPDLEVPVYVRTEPERTRPDWVFFLKWGARGVLAMTAYLLIAPSFSSYDAGGGSFVSASHRENWRFQSAPSASFMERTISSVTGLPPLSTMVTEAMKVIDL